MLLKFMMRFSVMMGTVQQRFRRNTPTLVQVPPSVSYFSMMTVLYPSWALLIAATYPPVLTRLRQYHNVPFDLLIFYD
jgi:hypothetical protein